MNRSRTCCVLFSTLAAILICGFEVSGQTTKSKKQNTGATVDDDQFIKKIAQNPKQYKTVTFKTTLGMFQVTLPKKHVTFPPQQLLDEELEERALWEGERIYIIKTPDKTIWSPDRLNDHRYLPPNYNFIDLFKVEKDVFLVTVTGIFRFDPTTQEKFVLVLRTNGILDARIRKIVDNWYGLFFQWHANENVYDFRKMLYYSTADKKWVSIPFENYGNFHRTTWNFKRAQVSEDNILLFFVGPPNNRGKIILNPEKKLVTLKFNLTNKTLTPDKDMENMINSK